MNNKCEIEHTQNFYAQLFMLGWKFRVNIYRKKNLWFHIFFIIYYFVWLLIAKNKQRKVSNQNVQQLGVDNVRLIKQLILILAANVDYCFVDFDK